MLRKTQSLLISLGLLCFAGCVKPTKPVTPAPKAAPNFSDKEALLLLYQDQENLIWREKISEKDNFEPADALYFNEDQFAWGIKTYPLSGGLLFLYGESSEDNSCHACGVGIGAAVFAVEGNAWKLQYMKDLGEHGSYGMVDSNQFSTIAVGPKRQALRFDGGFSNQGYTEGGFVLYEISPTFPELLAASTYADNAGTCSDDPKERDEYIGECYSYEGTLRFEPGKDPSVYDAVIDYKGTYISEDREDGRPEPYDHTVRYTFQNGKYKLASNTQK